MLALTTAELFRTTWPQHTAKRAAQAAHGSVATAKAWVAARFTPSADTLLRMAAENIELRAELIRRLEAFGYDTNKVAPADSMDTSQNGSEIRSTSRLDRSANPEVMCSTISVKD